MQGECEQLAHWDTLRTPIVGVFYKVVASANCVVQRRTLLRKVPPLVAVDGSIIRIAFRLDQTPDHDWYS